MAEATHRDLHQALVQLRQGASHLLDEFYDKIGRHHASISGHVAARDQAPADVSDSEIGFEASIELPGMSEKDLEVTIADNRLVVRGEKKQEVEKRTKTYHCQERYYGAVERVFLLPPGLDSDKTRAIYSNGILTVTVPRKKGAVRKLRVGTTR